MLRCNGASAMRSRRVSGFCACASSSSAGAGARIGPAAGASGARGRWTDDAWAAGAAGAGAP
eukprot:8090055-Lingulodinium_polyedra.AAC.1